MPWQKGQSGNPNGRPVNPECLTHVIRELGKEEIEFKGERKTRIKAAAQRLWNLALFGDDIRSLIYLINRLDGKPKLTQIIENYTPGEFKIILTGEEVKKDVTDEKKAS